MMYENYEWLLEADLSKYAGKWVVVLDKEVVASGDRKEIGKELAQIRKRYPRKRPMVAKVPVQAAMIV